MFRVVTVGALLLAGVVWADEKPRVAILKVEGAKAKVVRAQLAKGLCKAFTCVTPGRGEDVEVDAVVTGKVSKKGALALSVYYSEDAEPVTRNLKLKKGKLVGASLSEAGRAVTEAVEAKAAAGES